MTHLEREETTKIKNVNDRNHHVHHQHKHELTINYPHDKYVKKLTPIIPQQSLTHRSKVNIYF